MNGRLQSLAELLPQKTIKAGVPEIVYGDHGPADGWPWILGHGFPYDVDAEARLLRRMWSPAWAFDATFERTATAFDNPDFVEVVIHSYRHRYRVAPGDLAYAAIRDGDRDPAADRGPLKSRSTA